MTFATDIVDGMTTAELRAALMAFVEAVYRNDVLPDQVRLNRDLKEASQLTERLAYGECQAQMPLPRTYVTPQLVLAIRDAKSAEAAAVEFGIPVSTARGIWSGRSHLRVLVAA